MVSTSPKIERFYLFGIKATIFLIPFLSLYISSSMVFPYITGKNFAFRILVEFAAVLWIGLMIINREYRLRNSTLTLSILTFTFIAGLADLLGVNPYNSFWSNYERTEGYVTILHLALYFMILKSVLRTKKDWMVFFNIFLWVSFLVSIYALISAPKGTAIISRYMVEYGTRMHGTIGNPPFLASYLLLSIFLGLIIILNTKKTFVKYVYLLPIGLNALVIYLTATRGPILAAMMGITIFCLHYILRKSRSHREKVIKKVLLSIISIFIITFAFLLTNDSNTFIKHDRTLSRFATMFSDPSVQTRFNTWKMAWNGIKERPILGWGQENFLGVYTVNPIPFVEPQIWIDRAHNIVIDWLINAGILGLLSYLVIFWLSFYILWRAFQKETISKKEAILIVIALVVYFLQNLFTFDTINTYLIFFALLAYIDNLLWIDQRIQKYKGLDSPIKPALEGLGSGNDNKEAFSYQIKIKSISVAFLALLGFSAIAYFVNYKPIKESQLSRQMSRININIDGSFLPILDSFKKALSYKTFGDTAIRYQMLEVSNYIMRYKLFSQKGALEFIETTAEELEKGIALNHHNLEYLTTAINFYKDIAFYESSFIAKAESLIRECMRINPEYEWLNFALADVYILKKGYEDAFVIVKKMVDLHPENEYKQLKVALAAILTSREDVVSSALENVKRIRKAKYNDVATNKKYVFSIGELVLFAETYKEIGNLHKALQYYKELIASLPTNKSLDFAEDIGLPEDIKNMEAKFHFKMAEIYLNIGDKKNAVKEAKKAAELDPLNYTDEAKKIIGSITKKTLTY